MRRPRHPHWHDCFGKGHAQRSARRELDIEAVAGPVIGRWKRSTDHDTFLILAGQADKIGMVELFLLRLGQRGAGDKELEAVQRFRRLAAGHALKLHGEHVLPRKRPSRIVKLRPSSAVSGP